jgi:RHS repeat-associated protein
VIPGHGNDDGYYDNPDDDDDDDESDPTDYLESYTYRADNMLVGYQKNQEQAWTYTYDALTRRVAKERVKEHGRPAYEAWQKDETTYLGLSDTILRDSTEWKTWRTHVSQNALDYLVGPGGRACGAEEAYWWRGYGYGNRGYAEDRFYHYDIRGGLSAITFDKPGLSGTRLEYDAFGNLEGGSFNASFQWQGLQHSVWETVGYAGQSYDRESGLYAYKYRSYDPEVGQWLKEDPIRAGEAWYEFCAGNPVRFTDPDGLRHECSKDEGGEITTDQVINSPYGVHNPLINGKISMGLNNQISGYVNTTNIPGKNHKGIDMTSNEGNSVMAAADGIILYSGEDPRAEKDSRYKANEKGSGTMDGFGVGYCVMIMDNTGVIIISAHTLGKVKIGETVDAGDLIGEYVEKGKSGGAHLHFAEVVIKDENGEIINDPAEIPKNLLGSILNNTGYTKKEGAGEYPAGKYTIVNILPEIFE